MQEREVEKQIKRYNVQKTEVERERYRQSSIMVMQERGTWPDPWYSSSARGVVVGVLEAHACERCQRLPVYKLVRGSDCMQLHSVSAAVDMQSVSCRQRLVVAWLVGNTYGRVVQLITCFFQTSTQDIFSFLKYLGHLLQNNISFLALGNEL